MVVGRGRERGREGESARKRTRGLADVELRNMMRKHVWVP
jgi:hypothetical protein